MAQIKFVRVFLLCMLIAYIYGAAIFLIGFFPINAGTIKNQARESRPQYLNDQRLNPPAKLYSQTILMLVDALRSDFPTAKSMPFAYNNSCQRFNVRVNIPTVTMPRLKSLTTGTVSNFIDIILNIGRVESLPDSLIHRLHDRNETAVFAGDHTWINLFPNQFRRHYANSDSFFVNDFYEGDNNVTQVVSEELNRTDWTLLVLHYLGLDHIGHVEGNESQKISLKLREMDKVIHKIYAAKRFHSKLLLLTGDHGMKDGGGHGGSTTAELYVPLFIFMENCSTAFTHNEYNQIDLAPTLAILWSLEIPPVSIGCLIPELLQEYSLEDQLYAYYYNALHLIRKAISNFGQQYVDEKFSKWLTTAKSAHLQFLQAKRGGNLKKALFEDAKVHYLKLSREISGLLSESLVQFDYVLIGIGLTLVTLVTSHTLVVFFVADICLINGKRTFIYAMVIAAGINSWFHFQHYITTTGVISSCLLLVAIMISVFLLISLAKLLLSGHIICSWSDFSCSIQTLPLLCFLIFHTLSLISSSFIEREKKTWYYLGASTLIWLYVQTFRLELRANSNKMEIDNYPTGMFQTVMRQLFKLRFKLLVIGGLIICRSLFPTVFYSGYKETLKPWFSLTFVSGLAVLLLCVWQHTHARIQFIFYFLAVILIYCFRGLKGTVSFLGSAKCCENVVLTLFWAAVGVPTLIGLLFAMRKSKKQAVYQSRFRCLAMCFEVLLTALLIISALLHKPHNAVLVPCLIYTLSSVYEMCDKLEMRTLEKYKYLHKLICTILVANMYYFYQGNSNSFASIDLNPGYIGQTTYSPVFVGIFVTLNMYSAIFIAFIYFLTHILNAQNSYAKHELSTDAHLNFVIYFYVLTVFIQVLFYLWLLVFFRYHLFIYSVFAPKALYDCYRVVVLLVSFLLGTLNMYIFDL